MSDSLAKLEALREELMQCRKQLAVERARREIAERLSTGALELCAVNGTDELVAVLTESFRVILGAESAFVLIGKRGSTLMTVGSSNPLFAKLAWEWDEFTERVADGRPAIVLRADRIPGWKAQAPEVQAAVGSCLHVCVSNREEVVILVCVHSERSRFDRGGAACVDRITTPLAESWHRSRASEREAHLRRDAEEANRHLETARQELLIARDDAEQASHAKSSFLARMSHELRTPLAAIIGLTDLALTTELEEEPLEYIQKARSSATHLLTILNDILDFSKVEAGEMTLEKIPLSLQELIAEVERYASVLVLEKKVVLKTEVDMGGEALHRLGDPLRIKQVLLNLTSNAIKFTPDGEVRVSAHAAGADSVRFEVSDTGMGMTPEFAEQVFEPFRQAEESTQRRFGGSGLGLAICRELAGLMGGTVEVESELGVGSKFILTVPLPAAEAAACTVDGEESDQTIEAPPNRILLAEDNKVNQFIVCRMLERLGHSVVVADNGRIAVDAAMAEPFDLILMDMQMPEVDGLEATKELRRLLPHDLPIVALTANAIAGDRERCLEAGMSDYLSKPVSEADLSRVIAKYWACSESQRKRSA